MFFVAKSEKMSEMSEIIRSILLYTPDYWDAMDKLCFYNITLNDLLFTFTICNPFVEIGIDVA